MFLENCLWRFIWEVQSYDKYGGLQRCYREFREIIIRTVNFWGPAENSDPTLYCKIQDPAVVCDYSTSYTSVVKAVSYQDEPLVSGLLVHCYRTDDQPRNGQM